MSARRYADLAPGDVFRHVFTAKVVCGSGAFQPGGEADVTVTRVDRDQAGEVTSVHGVASTGDRVQIRMVPQESASGESG